MFKFRIVINLILSVAIGIPSQGIPSVATTNPQLLTQISTPVTENIFSNAEKGARWVDLGLQNWFSTHFKSVAHSVVNDVAYTISATPTPITQATASITAVSSPLFALMAYHDSLGGLSVVAADGTRQRQIRATGDKPVWANYGDQLAFIDKDSSGKAQVFTMTSVGHNVIQVTHTSNGVCGLPSWSPNDDQIAFGITSAITGCDLYTISANGLGTPQLLISQVRAFTWLANNVFSYSQPSGSSDMLGTAQFVPASQQALSVASVKSPSIKALPAVVPQTCGQVTNIQYAHNGGGIAYQVACSTGGSKYFLTDLLTGGVTQTNTQPVVIWLPQHGLLYGSAGNFSYAGSVADVVTSSSVLVAALSGLMGDLSTAATTNFIVEPDPVAGDHIVDPDFLSNGQLQRQLTLSNSYDPATGEDTFSAPDIGSNNQRTQPYASGTGHVDPASGQYKPGADTGAVLPSYGLYNRVPFSDYADPVSRSYAGTFQGVSLPGRGSPLDFRITYDPTNAWEDWSSTGEIGPGWSHNFAIKLFLACKYLTGYAWETPTNGQIFLQQSNGARIKFQDNLYAGSNPQIGNTRWATLTPGVYATLERVNLNSNGDGSYVPTEKLVEGSSCFPSDSGSIVQQHVYLVTLADNTVYTFNWVGLLIKIDHVHNSTKNQDWHPLNLIYNVSFNNPPSNPIQWISTRPSGYTCSYYPFAKGYQLLRVEDRDPGAPQPNNYLDFCYGPPNVLSDITLAEIHDNRGGSSSGSPSFQMQYSTQYQGKSTIIGLTDWKGKAWSFYVPQFGT